MKSKAGVVAVVVLLGCSQHAEPERGASSGQAASPSAVESASARSTAGALASVSARPVGSAIDTADLEAPLAADEAYAGIWEASRRKDLDLLLTAVSQHLTHGEIVGEAIGAARAARLDRTAATLALVQQRSGRYPDDFTKRLESHLEAIKGEPHLGTWSVPGAGRAPHDYAALALWLRAPRKEASYVLELLAARRLGPARWIVPSRSRAKAYLVNEKAALKLLDQAGRLGLEESARLGEIDMTGPLVRLPVERLAHDLVSDERREVPRIKGKVAEVAAVVAEVGKDKKTVMLAPTKPKEVGRAQCAFDERAAAKVASLAKGAKVTVQGRVDGLATHVVLSYCEIVGEPPPR